MNKKIIIIIIILILIISLSGCTKNYAGLKNTTIETNTTSIKEQIISEDINKEIELNQTKKEYNNPLNKTNNEIKRKETPNKDFIRRKGQKIIVGEDEKELFLRGINLDAGRVDPGNGDWSFNCPKTNCRPVYELWSEKDYEKIKSLGFNSVRLIMNYRFFESDNNIGIYNQEGWDWLDQHIEWAKNNNLYLILDLHVPQGGLQTSEYEDNIWDDKTNQERMIKLWKAIANRYKNNKVIAGYNLLNEPQPRNSCKPWTELAQKTIDAIREVDKNHLIIIEKCNWIRDANNYDGWYRGVHPEWQFLVNDDNVMYDFHFYMPAEYTLQCYPDNRCPEGISYPDNTRIMRTINNQEMPFTKEYLESEINTLTEFSRVNKVPMSIGEWAPAPATFGKGADEYIEDLVTIFKEYNLSWQYFDYWTIHKSNKLEVVRPEIKNMLEIII